MGYELTFCGLAYLLLPPTTLTLLEGEDPALIIRSLFPIGVLVSPAAPQAARGKGSCLAHLCVPSLL